MGKTREKIIETAYTCFAEKGYLGTTTKEIAEKAGVCENTIFRKFGSKEKLFEEVIYHYSLIPHLKNLKIDRNMPLEEMLEIIALKMYETLSKKKELIKIMLSEITVYPEKVREIYRKLIKDTDNTIVEIFKKNGIETKKVEEIINMFLGGVFSYFLKNEIFCLYSPNKEEIKEYLKTYASIIAKGIKSEEK